MRITLPTGLQAGGRFAEWSAAPVRLLCSDIDGTLLGPEKTPTPVVTAAVRDARAGGLRVGLCTGREWPGVRPLVELLALDGPFLLHNGAEVRDHDGVVAQWPLGQALAADLVALAVARGWYAELYVGDSFYVTDDRAQARPHWDLLGVAPRGTVADLDLETQVVIKATVVAFSDAELPKLLTALEALGGTTGVGFAPLTPDLVYINVTHPDVDKGTALRVSARRCGLALGEVAVMGDGYNDIPMLVEAGTAIAMGQAPAEVRAAAHLIAPAVLDHGAAVGIRALTTAG